jgi:hypothetical protein
MAVTAHVYDNAITSLANKEVDWGTDTVKVMLATSSYAVNQATHQYKSSVTNEVTGTGYTARGATLGSKTEVITAHVKKFDAADVSWTASTITARYAVVYDDTGSDATSALIAYVDFGADVVSTAGTFSITWDANGIFTVTVA